MLKDQQYNQTSRLLKGSGKGCYTLSTLNEYRGFAWKIYKVLGLDITEANHQSGFFYDPVKQEHPSYRILRSLWELIQKNKITLESAKAVRKEFKDCFEGLLAEAEANRTTPPKHLEAKHVKKISEKILAGEIDLEPWMDTDIDTARCDGPSIFFIGTQTVQQLYGIPLL